LPKAAAELMREFIERGSHHKQEGAWTKTWVAAARKRAAELLGAGEDEIALLGPTSLGLSLVAAGLPWHKGDEVVYYQDDYPANVYPWVALARRGVKPVALEPDAPGAITWEVVEAALTDRTRLVSLASAHFLSGFRIDVDTIGRNLHERGILFCVDGIQTLGAFPLRVEHVDFLSADSHKWMLGPAGAGIVYVSRDRFDLLQPALLGSWNVLSPQFIAQKTIDFCEGARRYEPGMLNLPGIVGMAASLEMLLSVGIKAVAERILHLRSVLVEQLALLGYRQYIEDRDRSTKATDAERSGIVTVFHPDKDMQEVAHHLHAADIVISLRHNREGKAFLRFSPHFYNTEDELAHVLDVLGRS
ncbi:MAG: aminotransferase class V-fold PLP-dependent enzyme, partial [Candidatus Hydrogenedentes bacterium]|nr:aminotransferase class V-fold PLP-dependent enzyme [Candidatus Hydrogenedentota bacterium]